MAYCRYCGTNNTDGAKYCTNCGSPLSAEPKREESKPYPRQQSGSQAQYAQQEAPGYERQQETYYQTQPREQQWVEGNVQSQGHWVLDTFLSCIPFVGLILLIVWSVTDQPDLSKQRWARAMLLWSVIGVIVGIVITVLFGALVAGLAGAYM